MNNAFQTIKKIIKKNKGKKIKVGFNLINPNKMEVKLKYQN